MADCRECKQPHVEIDNRAMYLTGCMTCNIWWTNEGEKVRLSEADLRALHATRRTRYVGIGGKAARGYLVAVFNAGLLSRAELEEDS
jgi:hypothetical protein